MAVVQNDQSHSIYPVGLYFVHEDTSFVSGDSPKVEAVGTYLGRNGNRGYVKVDGTGDILVEIGHNATAYGTQFTLKNGESFDLTGMEVFNIRITHSGTDSAFRVLVI